MASTTLNNLSRMFFEVEKTWEEFRVFSFKNRTIFELFFIAIYSLEQISLVVLTLVVKKLDVLSFIISLFAIIILTTFSFHKMMIESRVKILEEKLNENKLARIILENKKHYLSQEYQKVLSKNLNTITTHKDVR